MTKSGAAEGHIAQEPRIEEHKGGGYTYAYLPARKGNPLTLVMLHGTGGDHTSFIGMGRLVAPGAALIALRGDVVENGKLRFFRRTGEGVHDMSDLRLRTVRVADAITQLLAAHDRDPAAAVGIGYSSGASLLATLLFSEPVNLAAAVLMHPLLPHQPDGSAALADKPVLVTYARRDPIAPPQHIDGIVTRLRARGGRVTATLLEAGHEVREPELDAVRGWLRDFNGPAAARDDA